MKTRAITIGLGVATLGTGLGFSSLLAGSPIAETTIDHGTDSSPAAQTMILAFPWQGGHQQFIDTASKGQGPGDLFLGTDLPILDNATGERIGSGDGVEMIVSARHGGTVSSQSTLRLAGGHIDLDGSIRHTDSPNAATVTGGTGRYVGVGGQLTLLRSDSKRKVEVMRLELVR